MQTTPSPTFRRAITDQELLGYLARAARELRVEALSAGDYASWRLRCRDTVRPPTAHFIAHRLGGWKAAVRRAGIWPGVTRRQLSDARLLATLRRVAARVDGTLTMEAFDRAACRSRGRSHTYVVRFGSWQEALRRAGLAERNTRVRARRARDLEATLEALEALGPRATQADWARVRRDSGEPLLGARALISHYGSWESARRAARLAVAGGGRGHGAEERTLSLL